MCSMARLSETGPASFSAVACGRVLPARRCNTFSLIRCVMSEREPRLCGVRLSGKASKKANTGTVKAATPNLLRIVSSLFAAPAGRQAPLNIIDAGWAVRVYNDFRQRVHGMIARETYAATPDVYDPADSLLECGCPAAAGGSAYRAARRTPAGRGDRTNARTWRGPGGGRRHLRSRHFGDPSRGSGDHRLRRPDVAARIDRRSRPSVPASRRGGFADRAGVRAAANPDGGLGGARRSDGGLHGGARHGNGGRGSG